MPTVQTVIIGGGIAGLKAAHTLEQSNPNYVLLEAQSRVGGRIFTDSSSSKIGLKYDLGAAWFHDALTNKVLHELVNYNDRNVFDLSKDAFFDDRSIKYYCSEKEGALDDTSIKITQIVHDIERFIDIHFHLLLELEDVSLQDMVELYVKKYHDFLTPDQKNYCSRAIRYLELWYGIPWDKISGKYAVMDHEGRNLYNKKGYGSLVDLLLQGIPSEKIVLDCQVTEIDRFNKDNSSKMAVRAENEVYYCDYIVMAVPQSVLQLPEDHEYGLKWSPPLPNVIQTALANVSFGSLGKVILEFDDIWWDNNEERFEILADKSEVTETLRELTGLPEPFTYPAYVINYSAVTSSSHGSLVVLTQDPLTTYLEAHPEQAWEYYKPMVAKLAIKRMSEPVNIITTSWTKNPYIRGSYSSLEVGDDPNDILIYLDGENSTMSNRIQFAGEHTVSDGAGCVHGAYASGERAARVIKREISQT